MATVLFHAAVIAMLVLLRIYGNVKIPDAQGITINFGTDMTGAGEVEPQLRELLDALQPLDVVLRVAARVLGRTLRAHQPAPLVEAQRLRVHPRQLRRNGDHEERPVAVVLLSHDPFSAVRRRAGQSAVDRGSGNVAASFSNEPSNASHCFDTSAIASSASARRS